MTNTTKAPNDMDNAVISIGDGTVSKVSEATRIARPKRNDAVEHSWLEGDVTGYYYTSHKGHACVLIYLGNRSIKSSAHLAFPDEAQRADHMRQVVQRRATRNQEAVTRRVERSKPNELKVGDILQSSWGYDQTNVDFYQVTEVRGQHVIIQPIAADRTYDVWAAGKCVAVKDAFHGDPSRHLVQFGNKISINSYRNAYLWDGTPSYFSEYA